MYALVTGASEGIGAAIALELAQRGADILLCYKSFDEGANDVKAKIEELGRKVFLFKKDFEKAEEVHKLCSEILDGGFAPEIIVNNAGICIPSQVQDISDEDWDKTMNVNLKSVFIICHDLVPSMIEKKKGSIVNIASIWGRTGSSMESAYCASKAAIVMFSKSLAQELGPSGIRVNCVSPGCVDTKMNAGYSEDEKNVLFDQTPLERFAKPEEIAKAVAFLAFNDASFVTGEDLLVDGGFLI